jgi:hypothetical protein
MGSPQLREARIQQGGVSLLLLRVGGIVRRQSVGGDIYKTLARLKGLEFKWLFLPMAHRMTIG